MIEITLIKERIAAKINGVVALNQETTEGSESFPPRKGPIINPSPKAAPINPKFLALFSGVVTSAIAAWAIEILPPVTPSNMRDRKSKTRLPVIIP